jgi:hypothetical protein
LVLHAASLNSCPNLVLDQLPTAAIHEAAGKPLWPLSTAARTILAPRLELPSQHRKQRIVPKMIVVVQVLVAQRQPEHP